MDPFDPVLTVESIYRAWQQAERRYRALPPSSPDAAEALDGVNQLWQAYEKALGNALGRGVLRSSDPGADRD
ncbi:MAG: hypothetical protein ACRDGI_01935 [Candidatus Limnocylindrales bacterium]